MRPEELSIKMRHSGRNYKCISSCFITSSSIYHSSWKPEEACWLAFPSQLPYLVRIREGEEGKKEDTRRKKEEEEKKADTFLPLIRQITVTLVMYLPVHTHTQLTKGNGTVMNKCLDKGSEKASGVTLTNPLKATSSYNDLNFEQQIRLSSEISLSAQTQFSI